MGEGCFMARLQNQNNKDEVERRAYEIWEERGCEDGHALEHWLIAERECAAAAEPETLRRAATAQSGGRRF